MVNEGYECLWSTLLSSGARIKVNVVEKSIQYLDSVSLVPGSPSLQAKALTMVLEGAIIHQDSHVRLVRDNLYHESCLANLHGGLEKLSIIRDS